MAPKDGAAPGASTGGPHTSPGRGHDQETTAGVLPADGLMGRALALAEAGYGPLPLPHASKKSPPAGWTGATANLLGYADWLEYVTQHPTWDNLGVRIPAGVVVLDVDDYDGKSGKATWQLLNEGDPFPLTVVTSARLDTHPESGHRWYRLPDGYDQAGCWGAHDGVETLRLGHRYSMAPGSLHPSGATYQAVDRRTGEVLDRLPAVGDLPVLSPAQAARLMTATAPWARPGQRRPTGGHESPSGGERTGAAHEAPGDPTRASRRAARPCTYMAGVSERAVADIATGGSRHDRMTRATYALLSADAEGHAGLLASLGSVRDAFVAAVSPDRDGGEDEARAEFKRAVQDARPKIAPVDPMMQACCNEPVAEGGGEDLWSARPWLAWCEQVGRTRGLSRWGLVGAVLARASAEVAPEVRVASPVGTNDTCLNLFVLLLGRSGASKSEANGAVGRAWRWSAGRHRLGSGEGLAAGYTHRAKDPDPEAPKGTTVPLRHAYRLFAFVDEYGQVVAVKERGGATLGAELRTAWSGGDLGSDYRDPEKRLPVAADTYRLAVLAGIQPGLVSEVFGGANVGDLQRWLWFDAQDEEGRASWPALPPEQVIPPLPIRLPEEVTGEAVAFSALTSPGRLVMATEPEVRLAVWQGHQHQSDGGEHDNQQRLRLAGLLGLLDGRLQVSWDDWALAGRLISRSAALRDAAAAGLAAEAEAKARARGRAAALTEEAKADHDARRVAHVLAARVARAEGQRLGREALRQAVAGRDKKVWHDALAKACELGWLTEATGPPNPVSGKASRTYETGPSWVG